MTASEFSKIAGRLMRHPSVPFHEHAVRAEVETICRENKLEFKRDKFGNVIVRLRTAKTRPFVLAAHMDHPGFEIVRRLSAKSWLAKFLGGVPDEYFRAGVPVRLMRDAPPSEAGTMQSDLGSARVPRAADGVSPSARSHHLGPPFSSEKWSDEVCGETPQTTRRRRVLPSFNCIVSAEGGTTNLRGGVAAKLGRRPGKAKEFELHAARAVDGTPAFAVWELEDFAVRNGRIHGRGCDDLIGVASILATLIELKRNRARVHVIGVIARAEEIGFLGAMAVAAGSALPKNSLVVSLETSRELPGVKMEQGVILRVGDRTSIFDSQAMRFLGEVAAELKTKHKKFQFQRALMSGGSCEATAYQEFGFQTAAVCVALGNYHNCAPGKRIAAEFVSLTDALSMVELLAAAAKKMPQLPKLIGKLPKRLQTMLREAQPRLLKTAARAEGIKQQASERWSC